MLRGTHGSVQMSGEVGDLKNCHKDRYTNHVNHHLLTLFLSVFSYISGHQITNLFVLKLCFSGWPLRESETHPVCV
jgi:hypothetical protein